MFKMGGDPRDSLARLKKLRPGEKAPFMSKGEAIRMVLMAGALVCVVVFFMDFVKNMTKTPQGPKAVPEGATPLAAGAVGGQELPVVEPAVSDEPSEEMSPELRLKLEAVRAERERLRREYGLPEDAAGGVIGLESELPPIDRDLLGWVEDATGERERDPYHHLLRYVIARDNDQLDAAAEPADFDWLRLPVARYDEKIAAAKKLRGQVVSIKGVVLDMYARQLKREGRPREWIWEAIIADKDQNIFMVVVTDKEVETVKGDTVHAVGPFFKILRVETRDRDPSKVYKGYPMIVAHSLRKLEIVAQPPPFIPNPLVAIAVGMVLLVMLVIGFSAWKGSRKPQALPRRRSFLDNQKLRALDRTKGGSGDKAASAKAPTAAALGDAKLEAASEPVTAAASEGEPTSAVTGEAPAAPEG
ncbi:MAG: hypothetical protein ACYTFT_11660 [Planctomycetota bacterium]|jgi:hypothetical protein